MKIKNLRVEKLYGYIDKDINFNSDLTLLVGINGSGKTSVLNLINWLLNPSLPHLCVTEFVSLSLSFDYKGENYEIKCKQNEVALKYTIKSSKKQYNPLIVTLHHKPKNIKNDEYLIAKLIDNYTGLLPNKEEKETWDIVSSLPKPTIIGLDRHLFTEESLNNMYYEERMKTRGIRKNTSPIDRVKELINREYRKCKNEVSKLTNSLQNHFIFSSFDGNINIESLNSVTKKKLTLRQIEDAEKSVNNYFENYQKEQLTLDNRNALNLYFSVLKGIVSTYQEKPDDIEVRILYNLNANQFVKINKLLRKFEEFELSSKKVMESISNYLDTLNFFFKDSAKKIHFREDTFEIIFSNIDKDNNFITSYKDINHLSSGEQQILIMFSYIAFNSGDGRIFIIDEPELSLHIKWQEDFLDKLNAITPKGTQLILATHSPILANKKREKAIALLPYNV